MMVSRFFLRGDRNIFIRGKKTFLYGLLISGMMACLTGCHGRKSLEPFEVPETFDTSKQYTVTFWAKNDTNKAQTQVYEEAIKDFEELYPNIHVNMRLYTNYGTLYNDVITNISTGTTPAVCITYPAHIATYLTGSNVVVPLEELFENKKYGLGGRNAVQFVKEQASVAAQNAESIEVTGEDSLLCDIGLMFGVNDVYKALKKYNNGEISLKEARAVRDSVMHDGADVEDTWKFGSIVTDSLRHLSRYEGQWRKVYTVTIKMKSQTTDEVRVLMEEDGITPRYTDKQFSARLYELFNQISSISLY